MIEMREIVWPNGQTQLQYRIFQLGTDASGALTPAGSPGWGKWENVPRVDYRLDDTGETRNG